MQTKNHNVLKESQIDYRGLMECLYETEYQWRKMTPVTSTILPCMLGNTMQDEDGETFVSILLQESKRGRGGRRERKSEKECI